MDKRLLNFMLVAMLLFVGYMEFLKFMQPDPVANGNGPEAVGQLDAGAGDAAGDDAGGDSDDGGPNGVAEMNPVGVAVEQGDPENADAVALPSKVKRFTVGSIDPASGYSMLVTFNSRGAAVERVELSDPRYRDLEDKSAYVGHLGLDPVANGLVVTCVGDGTPAQKAGVLTEDVISSVGSDSTPSVKAFNTAREKFKFGDDVPVTVLRDGKSITLTLKSVRRPLEVIRPEAMPNGKKGMQQLSYLLTLQQIGRRALDYDREEFAELPSLRNENWLSEVKSESDATIVEFRFPISSDNLG